MDVTHRKTKYDTSIRMLLELNGRSVSGDCELYSGESPHPCCSACCWLEHVCNVVGWLVLWIFVLLGLGLHVLRAGYQDFLTLKLSSFLLKQFLCLWIYRKQTHTDRYLHKDSNHHPSQKRGVIKTPANRARVICQPEHLRAEIEHLHKGFLEKAALKKKYLEPCVLARNNPQTRRLIRRVLSFHIYMTASLGFWKNTT